MWTKVHHVDEINDDTKNDVDEFEVNFMKLNSIRGKLAT